VPAVCACVWLAQATHDTQVSAVSSWRLLPGSSAWATHDTGCHDVILPLKGGWVAHAVDGLDWCGGTASMGLWLLQPVRQSRCHRHHHHHHSKVDRWHVQLTVRIRSVRGRSQHGVVVIVVVQRGGWPLWPPHCQGGQGRIEGACLKGPNDLGPESEGEMVKHAAPHGQGHVQGQLAHTKATNRSGVVHPGEVTTCSLEPEWSGRCRCALLACWLLSMTTRRLGNRRKRVS
jgi:hypothetical protein